MSNQLFEYAKNRFVNPAKIIGVSIYSKQSQSPDNQGNYPLTYRVAIDLDVKEVSKATVYSDGYPTEAEAKEFLVKVPVN